MFTCFDSINIRRASSVPFSGASGHWALMLRSALPAFGLVQRDFRRRPLSVRQSQPGRFLLSVLPLAASLQLWVAVSSSRLICLSCKISSSAIPPRIRRNSCSNGTTLTASAKYFRSTRTRMRNTSGSWSLSLRRYIQEPPCQNQSVHSPVLQVSQCYPKETADFPSQLSTLLLESYGTLSPDTRRALVQNLVMLRNKDVINSITYVCTSPVPVRKCSS